MPEDLTQLEQIVSRVGWTREALLPVLQAVQAAYGYLPADALRRLCELTDCMPADVAGVAGFYTQFRHRPVGRHLIRVCHGTACHVKGSGLVHEALHRCLGIADGQDTDPAGEFTVAKVACLGCCTLAPAMQIDEVTFGHLTPQSVPNVLREFREYAAGAEKGVRNLFRGRSAGDSAETHGTAKRVPDPFFPEIRIGLGSCCVAKGSAALHSAIEEALAACGARARVKRVGCVGMCSQTPLVEVATDGQTALYTRVGPADAKGIIRRHFRPRGPIRRLAAAVGGALDLILDDRPAPTPAARREGPVASFLDGQMHLATEHAADADPLDLDEYIARGGFETLGRCLKELSPDAIIAEITASGLAGRGGAGFSTGAKWAAVRAAPAGDGRKYVICNGDEGDPGAFMDRMILESCPFRVIEGLAIAAYAVGAAEGVLYIRAEYPLAVRRVREALEACERRGLLGLCSDAARTGASAEGILPSEGQSSAKASAGETPAALAGRMPASLSCAVVPRQGVLGGGFSLALRVVEGAGAFVCGEETAMIASIEGQRGEPRFRPPFPARKGLHGSPTLINNVETCALVPWILRHGAERFSAIGTAGSKGTKVFALAGKVARGGLIEVPMGTTIRQIVDEIGGGVAGGKRAEIGWHGEAAMAAEGGHAPPCDGEAGSPEGKHAGETPRQLGATPNRTPFRLGVSSPAAPPSCPAERRAKTLGGGTLAPSRSFKAVQIGGPSGGCLPAALSDTPVDYAALVSAGAIMGSGGLIVLDDDDCMVDVARYFLQFTQDQSCGKCTFCRVGTRRMLDVLDRLCAGQGHKGDLEQLERLAASVKTGSLCGLGRTAPNPVLTTLRYFRDEYEAHLAGRCPAGRCKALIRYAITDSCIGCTLCAQHCPAGAIAMTPYSRHEVDDGKCVRCGTCRQVCPVGALETKTGRPDTVGPEDRVPDTGRP